MKLAKGTEVLWVAERRGLAVYSRRGKPGSAPIPKAKAFKTEADAEAFLDAQLDNRLAEGFVMIDATATLDQPFTCDGERVVVAPPRFRGSQAHYADQIFTHVRGGFTPLDEMDGVLDDLVDSKAPGLRARLERLVEHERVTARSRSRPDPCTNDAIDAAFAELPTHNIIGLQNAGYTQSDGWEDLEDAAVKLRARGGVAIGGCFYHFQDLERAVRDQGLMIGFGGFVERGIRAAADRDIAQTVLAVLQRHGVPASWSGDVKERIQIAPFTWWRPVA